MAPDSRLKGQLLKQQRRQTALSLFGVIHYRKRERDDLATAEESDEHLLGVRKPVADSIQDLEAVAEDVDQVPVSSGKPDFSATDSHPPQAAIGLREESALSEESIRRFDLRFWRCGDLLAIETARLDSDSPAVSAETRHRLVNNIFRAIFGAGIQGAAMYTHSWPDVAGAGKTDENAAQQWMRLFLKGQKAKHPETRLWLMGLDAIELLLADQGSSAELEGMCIVQSQLEMEIYITSSLDEMLSKPYLKASAWKLLRSLCPPR